VRKASGEVWIFITVIFTKRGEACHLSVTSISTISFKARKLKFCIQPIPAVNAKNIAKGIFWNFVSKLNYGFFSWLSESRQASVFKSVIGAGYLLHTYMRSLFAKFQLSSFKTEGGDRGDTLTGRSQMGDACSSWRVLNFSTYKKSAFTLKSQGDLKSQSHYQQYITTKLIKYEMFQLTNGTAD